LTVRYPYIDQDYYVVQHAIGLKILGVQGNIQARYAVNFTSTNQVGLLQLRVYNESEYSIWATGQPGSVCANMNCNYWQHAVNGKFGVDVFPKQNYYLIVLAQYNYTQSVKVELTTSWLPN